MRIITMMIIIMIMIIIIFIDIIIMIGCITAFSWYNLLPSA